MMGVTHIWVGTMAAVLLMEPKSPEECLAALIGGAMGSIACDIDLGAKTHQSDTSRSRQLAGGIVLACIMADSFFCIRLMHRICTGDSKTLAAGLVSLLLLCLWGWNQPHRGGCHSLLTLALFTRSVDMIFSMLARPFMVAMASHLVLDLLNCSPIRLLYPLGGRWCLGLCRADGWLDRHLKHIGVIGTILGVGIAIGRFL